MFPELGEFRLANLNKEVMPHFIYLATNERTKPSTGTWTFNNV